MNEGVGVVDGVAIGLRKRLHGFSKGFAVLATLPKGGAFAGHRASSRALASSTQCRGFFAQGGAFTTSEIDEAMVFVSDEVKGGRPMLRSAGTEDVQQEVTDGYATYRSSLSHFLTPTGTP
jgi:hypothetical protein